MRVVAPTAVGESGHGKTGSTVKCTRIDKRSGVESRGPEQRRRSSLDESSMSQKSKNMQSIRVKEKNLEGKMVGSCDGEQRREAKTCEGLGGIKNAKRITETYPSWDVVEQ